TASAESELTQAHARMLGRIQQRVASKETKVEYLSRLAWALIRLKDMPSAEKLLDRALALKPAEPATRKELAGVLAAAGRHALARQMYDGLKLTLTDRLRLAEIDLAGRRFDDADMQVQAVLRLRPGHKHARLVQAAILAGRKRYAEAGKLYEELARDHPDDTAIPLKLAEVALWSEDYDTALIRFQELLEKNPDQPAIWKGYVDAAASAKTLPESCRAMAVHVHQKVRSTAAGDAVFLTRLAWVLRRVKEPDRAIEALERALALDPNSRSIRLQLAETLYERGDHAQAEQHFKVLLGPRPAASK